MTRQISPEAQPKGNPGEKKKKGSSTVASLEFIRGLASLDVFVWHLLNADIPFPHIPGLYRLVGWSRESVIVFFVLSGYVISLSQKRFHREAGPFLIARVKRIFPIYWIALAMAFLVAFVIQAPYTLWQFVGHLLFLQSYEGSLVIPLSANGPLWSLGTEFEFYLLLSLVLFLRRPVLLLVWWGFAIAGMLIRHAGYFGTGVEGLLLEFLGLSPCWLLGYFFAGLGRAWTLSLSQALTLFCMIPMVSWCDVGSVLLPTTGYDDLKCYFLALLIVPLIHTLAKRQLHPQSPSSRYGWLIVAIAYLCLGPFAMSHAMTIVSTMAILVAIPIFFWALMPLLSYGTWLFEGPAFRRVALFMGGSSYALYAIHTPFFFLVPFLISSRYLQLPILVLSVAGAVLLLEYVIQPRAAAWIVRICGKLSHRGLRLY